MAALVLLLAPRAQGGLLECYQSTLEAYVGVYGGAAFVCDTDIDTGVQTFPDQSFDTGSLVGAKLGWGPRKARWLAWELNAWNTWTRTERLDLDLCLLNVSGTVLLRHLIGPLRLYVGGGVLGTWAELEGAADSDDLAVGALGQAGAEYTLSWPVAWGIFVEHRYCWNSFTFGGGAGGKIELSPSRREVMGGVNFAF